MLVEEAGLDLAHEPVVMSFPTQIVVAWFGLPLIYFGYWYFRESNKTENAAPLPDVKDTADRSEKETTEWFEFFKDESPYYLNPRTGKAITYGRPTEGKVIPFVKHGHGPWLTRTDESSGETHYLWICGDRRERRSELPEIAERVPFSSLP